MLSLPVVLNHKFPFPSEAVSATRPKKPATVYSCAGFPFVAKK